MFWMEDESMKRDVNLEYSNVPILSDARLALIVILWLI